MKFNHIPVLLNECIDALNIKPNGIYVDGTAGGGGHSLKIAEKLSSYGRLICIDRDEEALSVCKKRLSAYDGKIYYIHSNFSQISEILDSLKIDKIDGMLLDLGVSSYQLDNPSRGFSYNHDAMLDMRMDKSSPFTAKELINTYGEHELEKILRVYGEERFCTSIARNIVKERENKVISTTFELVEIIKKSLPAYAKREKHPAKRSFQAIRIAVNDELNSISKTLAAVTERLKLGGRLAVISFHSLEDRIVKAYFNEAAVTCTCPPSFPVCICGTTPKLKVITKKPMLPNKDEIKNNLRSKSAKLRVAERL